MNIVVVRLIYSADSTRGAMFLDGDFFCYTLEDVVRRPGAVKIYGKTAIPSGIYKIILSMSNRFKKIMPEILDVPGFSGIRCHGGNTAADTEGCILVAKNAVDPKAIQGSMSDVLISRMKAATGAITIRIIDSATAAA